MQTPVQRQCTLPPISVMEDGLYSRSPYSPLTPSSSHSPTLQTPFSGRGYRAGETTPPTSILPDPYRPHPTYNRPFPPSPHTSSFAPLTPPQPQLSDLSRQPYIYESDFNNPVGKEVEKIIHHCDGLSETMSSRKDHFKYSYSKDTYDPTMTRPVLDDMIGRANEVLNALLRLRKHQISEEQARTNVYQKKEINYPKYRVHTTTDDWSGGTNQRLSGTQRRRGKRAVFRGKCHSCNISETPEWRRGPDGARTLCNACGLHYAKLTRKQAAVQKLVSQKDHQSRNSGHDIIDRPLVMADKLLDSPIE
ncbi:hypothetical protein CLU79DRAFT_733426 [Phycomyces nitens]|nr:hypothetical protein CLU79DRAFT_733426 [Phycomyces nitens]